MFTSQTQNPSQTLPWHNLSNWSFIKYKSQIQIAKTKQKYDLLHIHHIVYLSKSFWNISEHTLHQNIYIIMKRWLRIYFTQISIECWCHDVEYGRIERRGWSIAASDLSHMLGSRRSSRSNTEKYDKIIFKFYSPSDFTWFSSGSGLDTFQSGLLMQKWSWWCSPSWKSTTLNSTLAPSGMAKICLILVCLGYFSG